MHECQARPGFTAANPLVPAHYDKVPLLDVFIIKLFAAPCKFADRPAAAVNVSESITSQCLHSTLQHQDDSHILRSIAPNMRTELTRIAASTLEFLDKVSKADSTEVALQLLSKKAVLLDSLESWLNGFTRIQTETGNTGQEPISVLFLRIFHLILKTILLDALDSSSNLYAEQRTELEQLQSLANEVNERVRDYVTCIGSSSGQGERSVGR